MASIAKKSLELFSAAFSVGIREVAVEREAHILRALIDRGMKYFEFALAFRDFAKGAIKLRKIPYFNLDMKLAEITRAETQLSTCHSKCIDPF